MRLSILAMCTAVALLAAGCTQTDDTPGQTTAPTTSQPATGTCSISLDELPGHAEVGTHAIKVQPQCGFAWESKHIAAHYATTSTETPTLQHYSTACTPVEGKQGDEVIVECEFDTEGTFYLRGHTIITIDGEAQHFWTPEYVVVVIPVQQTTPGGVDVSIWNVPSMTSVGEEISFRVVFAWADGNATSDHLGAHYANASSETGSTTHYAAACDHQPGDVPGEFTVTCTFQEPGTKFLRGHGRFENGGQLQNHWSHETTIEVEA